VPTTLATTATWLHSGADLASLSLSGTAFDGATVKLAQSEGRELDKFESEALSFFERVRMAYLRRANAEPQRFRVIDAARPLAEVRVDLQRIVASL
jgi:dTMP kinase